MPVELTVFNGQNKQGINLLTWETATETNNDYFSIAHSSDGFSWQEIDKVSGAGNSTEVKTYSLDHRNFPSAINYYRLTQVDFDGKREVFRSEERRVGKECRCWWSREREDEKKNGLGKTV